MKKHTSILLVFALVLIVSSVYYVKTSDKRVDKSSVEVIDPVTIIEKDEDSAEGVTIAEKTVDKWINTSTYAEADPIFKYYKHISNGELQEAYNMKYEPEEDFETFESWYGKTVSAIPFEFGFDNWWNYDPATDNKTFRFQVALDSSDTDIIEEYTVFMEIVDGKLKTISSKSNDYCNDDPIPTAIGSSQLPISFKYRGLKHLGQIFTAYECGSERVNKIWGIENGTFTLGSTLTLNNYPSDDFIKALSAVGYLCKYSNTSSGNCKVWKMVNDKKIDELMKLEPFHEEISYDDCLNCG